MTASTTTSGVLAGRDFRLLWIGQSVSKTGSAFAVPWGQIMAATVIVTLPLITATLILQRRILAGLTAGAVKG